MNKSETFERIRWDLEKNSLLPLYAFRKENGYQPVPGAGSFDARIMFIGEAPGKKEAETGQPFVGAAGKVLTELLTKIGLDRKDVFITSILQDRPPDNRDPKPEEIVAYAPYLDRILEVIQPQIIATLGRFSMEYIFRKFGIEGQLKPISKLHGQIFKVRSSWGEIHVVPLYHPAVALYRAPMKATLMEDILKLAA